MRSKKADILLMAALAAAGATAGCGKSAAVRETRIPVRHESSKNAASDANAEGYTGAGRNTGAEHNTDVNRNADTEPDSYTGDFIRPGTDIDQLKDGFSVVRYDGDYWFSEFLEQGGASSDSEVIDFLTGYMQMGKADRGSDSQQASLGNVDFVTDGFGCSTLAAMNQEGEALFGRNFDWENCEALVVQTDSSGQEGNSAHTGSTERYASISTVNMDFIRSGYGAGLKDLPDKIRTIIALYAPLDGMNEKGLAVSVNMIQDSAVIHQDTEKPDITTTTAIRLLLDRAADVEEAVALLGQYDMHSSMGLMVHFALADRSGRSVVVEYVGEEDSPRIRSAESSRMIVTETPAVTNFYLAPGEKQGIGTLQSHDRYEILMECLSERENMSMDAMRDALDSVSKDNFGSGQSSEDGGTADNFESTEWSIVFNLNTGEARYYHREDYTAGYRLNVNE